MVAHIKLTILSQYLMSCVETICEPLFNDVHFYPLVCCFSQILFFSRNVRLPYGVERML